MRERTKTLEDQLSIADQIFQNVNRVLEEQQIIDQELNQHIGMFMDNNHALLKFRTEAQFEEEPSDNTEENYRGAGQNRARRTQPMVKIREGLPPRKIKKPNALNQ